MSIQIVLRVVPGRRAGTTSSRPLLLLLLLLLPEVRGVQRTLPRVQKRRARCERDATGRDDADEDAVRVRRTVRDDVSRADRPNDELARHHIHVFRRERLSTRARPRDVRGGDRRRFQPEPRASDPTLDGGASPSQLHVRDLAPDDSPHDVDGERQRVRETAGANLDGGGSTRDERGVAKTVASRELAARGDAVFVLIRAQRLLHERAVLDEEDLRVLLGRLRGEHRLAVGALPQLQRPRERFNLIAAEVREDGRARDERRVRRHLERAEDALEPLAGDGIRRARLRRVGGDVRVRGSRVVVVEQRNLAERFPGTEPSKFPPADPDRHHAGRHDVQFIAHVALAEHRRPGDPSLLLEHVLDERQFVGGETTE